MTNEEVLIKQNKWLTYSAINALGPFVKINDNYEPNKVSYAIAAGHLRDLIRDVSAELTDEQKDCLYCHEDTTILESCGQKVILDSHEQRIIMDDGFSDSLSVVDTFCINFCPKCGRKLGI